jgi:riboflavin kinase/FMN adenylyltransferase
MQHFWSLDEIFIKQSWLTIGSFDGVHVGHQRILRNLTNDAHRAGAPAVVLTFYPHPAVVLGKRENAFYLTTPEEQAELLGELGADIIITHPFTKEIANTSAQDFIAELDAHLDINCLWIGYDFALGKDRKGDAPTLRRLGERFGYRVKVVDPVRIEGEIVSSSRIRKAIYAGEVEQANRLLGRPYRIGGEVIHGDGRGRRIGIPTANMQVWEHRVLPKPGVYVCRAQVNQETWGAVTNVGFRPTFEGQPPSPQVEAHLLDFDRDLYGEQIHLDFLVRLRDERRFPDAQTLVRQIHEDIRSGRKILSTTDVESHR